MPPGTSPPEDQRQPPLARKSVSGDEGLLTEFREVVQALKGLVTTLQNAAERPPVHMQVEHLEVERLEFHLGDIDVQELGGELNIGITHSLKVEAPKEEKQVKVELPKGTEVKLDLPKDAELKMQVPKNKKPKLDIAKKTSLELTVPKGTELQLGATGKEQPPTLPNSVITRWLQQGPPAPASPSPAQPSAGGEGEPKGRKEGRQVEPDESADVRIWPPPDMEDREKP